MRVVVAVLALSATAIAAQSSENTFEVVSVKPTRAVERGGGSSGLQPGGRFIMTNGPVRVLLNWAYGTPLRSLEIFGAPDWVTHDNYDVEARAGRDLTTTELAPFMRELLAGRFALRAHLETRMLPIYELRVAETDGRLGPALRPSTVDCDSQRGACSTTGGDGVIQSNGTTMTRFATWMPTRVGRPVVDKTGLSGNYELLLEDATAAADDAPSIYTALREQLGLMLEPVDAPTEVLVIDHIERPSEN